MRVRVLLCSMVAAVLLCGRGTAQMGVPIAPAEMQRLDAFVGSWTGTGKFPAFGSRTYTSTLSARRGQVGQHFIEQEVNALVLPEAETPSIIHEEFRVIWYDQEEGDYRVMSFGEAGRPLEGTAKFASDRLVITYETSPFGPGQAFRLTRWREGATGLKVLGEVSSDDWESATAVFEVEYTRSVEEDSTPAHPGG